MKSLFDAPARAGMLERISRLTADARPRWGRLTGDRAVVHLADGLALAFGEAEAAYKPSVLSTPLGRWLVIDSPIPWPKGKIQATAEFFRTAPSGQFERDRTELSALVERFARGRDQRWGRSPFLGDLSPEQWARLNWRHLDHHLRQFGV